MQLGRFLGVTGVLGGFGYWLWRYFEPQHSVLVLNGKVVVITGASSGIGRELALAFAQQGCRLVLAARGTDALDSVRREVEPYAAEVVVVPTDIAQEEDIQRLVQTALDSFGRIDVLVNNAGVTQSGFLHDQDRSRIRRMVEVNLTAPIRLTQEVLPHMLVHRQGYIVNIGSLASRLPTPLFSSYNATKSGLAGFSDSIRRELKGTGIRVMLALPAWTRSDTSVLREEWQTGYHYLQFPVETAEDVALEIVEALVRGEREIVFGGSGARWVLFLERHLPRAMNLYWRVVLGREWVVTSPREQER